LAALSNHSPYWIASSSNGEGPASSVVDKSVWVNSKQVIDGRDQVTGADRVINWITGFLVGGAKDNTLLDTSTRQ
jgi:hypothetical protein